ncbi:MAG: hypothetical protein V4534_00245 [Myxococcota bacterium]
MYQIIAALVFSSICLADISATDRYLAYTGELLGQNHIGDDHLLAIIEGAEKGQVTNPIREREARVSIAHQIAYLTYEQLIAEELDFRLIISWAERRLSAEKRKRIEQEIESRKTYFIAWKLGSSPLAVGPGHTCVLKMDGTPACWGRIDKTNAIPSGLGPVSSISTNSVNTCVIKMDGSVFCWGLNAYGIIDVPPDLGTVKSIALGEKIACVVKDDDHVACWGDNSSGQLNIPLDIGPVQAIAPGPGYVCVIKANRLVACWGNNEHGQLNVPLDLGPVQALDLGKFHVCAVKANGAVVCWGSKSNSQVIMRTPEQGFWSSLVQAVSAWMYHTWELTCLHEPIQSIILGPLGTCVHNADNSVACLGGRAAPELGPVQILRGGSHFCAVKVDGHLTCWGMNTHGQTNVPDDLGAIMPPL